MGHTFADGLTDHQPTRLIDTMTPNQRTAAAHFLLGYLCAEVETHRHKTGTRCDLCASVHGAIGHAMRTEEADPLHQDQ